MRHLLLTLLAGVLLVACGGGKATPPPTVTPQPTPNAKATTTAAMAQAEKRYELYAGILCSSVTNGIQHAITPESGICSAGEVAALRPSLVLAHYANIIRDLALETQAWAMYQQTKAAYEAAHAAVPPVIVVRPAAPPIIYDDSGAAQRDAQRKLDDLRRCINLNLNGVGLIC